MKKVILHNSHTDPLTPGRTGTKGEQKYQVEMHAKLADALEARGYLTDIYAGKNLPNGAGGNLYLTLHLNGALNASAHGFCVSIYPKSTTPEKDQKIKDLLIEKLSGMPIRNYQGYETENSKYMYGLTRISKTTPGALVELGFATNPNENAWLQKHQDEVVGYVADAIFEFFGKEKEDKKTDDLQKDFDKLYERKEYYKDKVRKIKDIINS